MGLETVSTLWQLVDDQTWSVPATPVGICGTGRDMGATTSVQ